MRRALFLNSGQIYLYLIGWDASAGCFLFQIAIKTMASRFVGADNDVIEELKISEN
jgi:hypothetical protein